MADPHYLKLALDTFPAEPRAVLEEALTERAVLAEAASAELMRALNVDLDQLMLRLLPVAAAYALVPISNYRVGVVASAESDAGATLYLGANSESLGGSLSYSVHAEQSAVLSAWLNAERALSALAISAAPCGYCRQFLNELACAEHLELLLPAGASRRPLLDFLPQAFGPGDLGVSAGLLQRGAPPLVLAAPHSDDSLLRAGLAAAQRSYAPYSGGFAGVALETQDQHLVAAPYAENAAYNPSLSPMSAALNALQTNRAPGAERQLKRALLVEVSAKTSQLAEARAMLACYAPRLELEHYRAELRTARA